MKAKHQTKNAMPHTLVFLAAAIAIAIIAAFSICATSQAKAEELVKNGDILNSRFLCSSDSAKVIVSFDGDEKTLDFINNNTIGGILESAEMGDMPPFLNAGAYQEYDDGKKKIFIVFNESGTYGSTPTDISVEVPVAESEALDWQLNGETVSYDGDYLDLDTEYTFCYGDVSLGTNIAGRVMDAQTNMPVPFANVVYCQYNPWWDMYLPVEGVEPVKTDMWGGYTIEGITEEMLPGKVFVYDGIKQIGESEPIWFFPEDMETLYMWPILINQEQPDPPVPPTPPDPPVPPGPNPPEPVPPVPPVPPTPVPTPDNPGGGIAQTGDATPFAAVAVIAVVAALGCGIALRKETWRS